MAPIYSDKVLEHFKNPRNVGELDAPDGVGVEGNPVCGDLMEIQIKVEDNIITDVPALLREVTDERAKMSDTELLLIGLGRRLRE